MYCKSKIKKTLTKVTHFNSIILKILSIFNSTFLLKLQLFIQLPYIFWLNVALAPLNNVIKPNGFTIFYIR